MKRPNLLSLLLRLVVLGLATLATHVLFTASMSQETRLGASHTPSSGKLVKSSWIRETRKKQSQMLLSCSHLDVPSVAQVTDWLHLTGPQGNVTLNDKSAYFYLPSIPKSPAATVFCGYVLVSLSGKYREPRPHFHPIPGFPPDSVEINAVGLKSTTFGRMGREPLLSTTVENVLVRVYAASVDLRDAGEYTISGTLECTHHPQYITNMSHATV